MDREILETALTFIADDFESSKRGLVYDLEGKR